MGVFTRAGCAVLLAAAAGWAQTAQINGTVVDTSGLAIPAAEIKATQTATGVVRSTLSSADGSYVLPNLPVGPYMIEVVKEGFTKYVQTGIVLEVDSNPTIEIAMKVGAVNEQVTVEAGAAQVETHTTSVGQVVNSQQISEMPLNGRNPIELVFLAGMASYPGNGAVNSVRNYPTVAVAVAGGQPNGVGYLLDGAIYQDPYNNMSLPLPFPDAFQEFNVETSAVPAQYGYHASAVVTAVTKSGTNQYHGDLFDFLRNGDLDSRDFFAATRDTLRRNQFGGTIGGPIKKDKLFFFLGNQETLQRSAPTQNTAFIPTPAAAAGDFSALMSPACNNGQQITLPSSYGFVNNQISPTMLNPVALNILKTMPTPINNCGQVLYGLVTNEDEELIVGRMDYQQSSKNSIFGRFTLGHLTEPSTYNQGDPLTINTVGINDLDYQLALGDTYLISSNVISSLRIAASRTNVVKVPDNYGSFNSLGANVTPLAGNTDIAVTAGGDFTIGGGAANPGAQHDGPNWSVTEDISWVKGAHQFTFGGNIYRQMMDYFSYVNATGTATFTGQFTGNILADYMIGLPATFSQGTVYGFFSRQYYGSLYAQDSWKVNRRLTLNYGVRWEPYTSIWVDNGQIVHFNPALFDQNYHSPVFANAPAGAVFPGDPHYGCGNSYTCDSWAKFLPRIGLAWDPQGNGRMTIRAAYGMYQDRMHMFWPNQNSFSPPFGNTLSPSSPTLSNPWINTPGGNPMPLLATEQIIGHASPNLPFYDFGSYVNVETTNFQPTYINQWNLSIQRQLGQNWLVSVNYLGNHTVHEITSEEANPAVFLGTGPCTLPNGVHYTTCSTVANQNFRRQLYLQNPAQGIYYGGIGDQDSGGVASYEGLYLSVQKRLSKGLTMLTNYTWSHCTGDVYDQQTTQAGVSPNVPGNRNYYYGNCVGIDQRQLFVLNLVATTPKFQNKWGRWLGSDWQIAPIMQIKSAQLYSIAAGVDNALSTAPDQTPNLVNPSAVYPAKQTLAEWVNPAAFAQASLGTYGNLGWNNIKGPDVFQLNVALSRTFVLHENKALQIRAEAFNLPNHLNPAVPGASPTGSTEGSVNTLNSSTFGKITSDISGNDGISGGDPRIIQMVMKFVF
jgi:hypothetical protein